MNTTLWLDLEDTIITPVVNGWSDFELINVQKIRDVIRSENPDSISIFSFAIHNEFELRGFERHVRPIIERVLSTRLDCVPTVDGNIIPEAARNAGIHPDRVSFSDIVDFWGKAGAFKFFIRARNARRLAHVTEVTTFTDILLDDSVFDETLHLPGVHTTLDIRNIDEL